MRRTRSAPLLVLIVLALLALGGYLLVRALVNSDLIRAALEQQLAARLGQPVHIGSATVAVLPRVALDLHDVRIGAPAAVELGEVRLVTGLRPLLARTVRDAEVVVRDGRLSLPLPFPLAAAGEAATAPDPGAPAFTVTSVRLIALRNVSLEAGGESLRIDLDASVDGDRLDIARLTARAEKTSIEASGTLTSIARLQGRLEAGAELLDAAEMIAIGSALTAPGLPPGGPAAGPGDTPPAMSLTVVMTAAAGRFGAYEVHDLATDIEIAPGRLQLSPLALRIFGGSFHGHLDADTGGAVPQLRVKGRVDGVDVGRLPLGDGSGGVTGRLGGTIAVSTRGTDATTLLHTARGTVEAAITDGVMPGLDMVRTVVLAFGRPAAAPPEGSGSAFTRLGGTFQLAAGTLASENLAIASRDFDLAGRGALNMITGEVEANVSVLLSEELTAQAGTDLRRVAQEDGRVVIPATVSGTLQRTVVSLDLAAATRRAIVNELQRRTKSLLDDLFKRKGP